MEIPETPSGSAAGNWASQLPATRSFWRGRQKWHCCSCQLCAQVTGVRGHGHTPHCPAENLPAHLCFKSEKWGSYYLVWVSGFEKHWFIDTQILRYPVLVTAPHSCPAWTHSHWTHQLVSAKNCNVEADLLYLWLQEAQGALLLFLVAQGRWTLLCVLRAALPFHNLRSRRLAPDPKSAK